MHFWVNDDDDDGETDGNDTPGAGSPDAGDSTVDGTRDLVDFFPVLIDLSGLRDVSDTDIEIRLGGKCNFFYTTLTASTAGSYLTNSITALQYATALVTKLDGQHVVLNRNQNFDQNGQCVILVELPSSDAELWLELYDTQRQCSYRRQKLALSVSGVEQMFRHKNLLGARGVIGGEADRLGPPANLPDDETINKNFVFVHGYSVSPEQARGAQGEVFKRMFWSGSKARFYGVTWYGYESKLPITGITPNYHKNVVNAFGTAENLASFLRTLRGETIVAAHSLGNMLVASALHDWGANLANVNTFFMLNAAVAIEAFDSAAVQSDAMINRHWPDYEPRLRATEWHTLFQNPPDKRRSLTWRNRLANLRQATVYNFFSSGEDVLEPHPADGSLPETEAEAQTAAAGGRTVWALQEKLKGRMLTGLILGSNYGGWGFGRYRLMPFVQWPPAQAAGLTDEQLRRRPFFKDASLFRSLHDPEDGRPPDINAVNAFVDQNRNQLLAQAFPALTAATGASRVTDFEDRNFDMNVQLKSGWPEERSRQNDYAWKHSDLKSVAYLYVHGLFDKLVEKGQLR